LVWKPEQSLVVVLQKVSGAMGMLLPLRPFSPLLQIEQLTPLPLLLQEAVRKSRLPARVQRPARQVLE
jgi:hypothetical protein